MNFVHASKDDLDQVLRRLRLSHSGLVAELPSLKSPRSSPHLGVVLDDEGRLHANLSRYILDLNSQPGRRLADRTIESYIESAIDFERWLSSELTDISEARFVDVTNYRNVLKDDRKYADNSINLYMAGLVRYVRWVVEEGAILNDAPISKWGINSQKLVQLKVRITPASVNVPSIRDFVALIKTIPMPYRLMLIWYQATGLRRSELPRLNLESVPEKPKKRLVKLKLARKGGYTQVAYVPLELMALTNKYIKFERQMLATTKNSGSTPMSPLFLNVAGRRATGTSAYRALKKSANLRSLRITLHSLRHLFAVEIYDRLKKMAVKNPDINPLKILQKMLGHRSIETTLIYLKSLPIPEEEISEALSSLLADIL